MERAPSAGLPTPVAMGLLRLLASIGVGAVSFRIDPLPILSSRLFPPLPLYLHFRAPPTAGNDRARAA